MKNKEKDLLPRTRMFARHIIRLYVSLSKTDVVAQVFGKQVLRSGTSVGANYREANRARFKAEFISKMGDCPKEADETLEWLELLLAGKIVTEKKACALVTESSELVAFFITILKKARGQA